MTDRERKLIMNSDVDPDTRPGLNYEQGYNEGKADCLFIVVNERNQNGNTFEAYCKIRDTLVTAIYSLDPTDWQRGYGEGFDAVAQLYLDEETDL